MNCPAGTFRTTDMTDCENCQPGKYVNSDATACVACAPGYFQELAGKTACAPCGSGEFQDESNAHRCKACRVGYSTLLDSAVVTSAAVACVGAFAGQGRVLYLK